MRLYVAAEENFGHRPGKPAANTAPHLRERDVESSLHTDGKIEDELLLAECDGFEDVLFRIGIAVVPRRHLKHGVLLEQESKGNDKKIRDGSTRWDEDEPWNILDVDAPHHLHEWKVSEILRRLLKMQNRFRVQFNEDTNGFPPSLAILLRQVPSFCAGRSAPSEKAPTGRHTILRRRHDFASKKGPITSRYSSKYSISLPDGMERDGDRHMAISKVYCVAPGGDDDRSRETNERRVPQWRHSPSSGAIRTGGIKDMDCC
jgi:hypothetical protein